MRGIPVKRKKGALFSQFHAKCSNAFCGNDCYQMRIGWFVLVLLLRSSVANSKRQRSMNESNVSYNLSFCSRYWAHSFLRVEMVLRIDYLRGSVIFKIIRNLRLQSKCRFLTLIETFKWFSFVFIFLIANIMINFSWLRDLIKQFTTE